MREHMGLFRGKRTDNGEWIKGFYHYTDWVMPPTNEFVKRTHSILPLKSQDAFDVDPETVGECTGLTDRNGTLIFEGDVLKYGHIIGVVNYYAGCFCIKQQPANISMNNPAIDIVFEDYPKHIKVIGNIHDNPELLE